MSTTYNNPKEMLGYKIIQDLSNAPEILRAAPYDRKAAWAYYYILRHLHSQMVSFHGDMFLIDLDEKGEPKRYPHNVVYPIIIKKIRDNWSTVYSNQQDILLEALFDFSELLSSCFPKLGLVPETNETIEEERIIDPSQEEVEVDNEPVRDHDSPGEPVHNEEANPRGTVEKSDTIRKPTGYRFS